MKKEYEYLLVDITYVGLKNNNFIQAFVENNNGDKIRDLYDGTIINKVKDSKDFLEKYGFDPEYYYTYSGLQAIDVLADNKAKSAILANETYIAYKKTRPSRVYSQMITFATNTFLPVKDILETGELVRLDYHKKSKQKQKVQTEEELEKERAKKREENAIYLLKRTEGRDF